MSRTSSSSSSSSSLELRAYLVSELPSSIYYLPDFLPPWACDVLLTTIRSTPPHKWTNLAHRRLLSLPSPLTGKARDTLVSSSTLPTHVTTDILPKLKEIGIFKDSPHGAPNHVLVNEYLPGQGIMPHEDGSAYHPVTATFSLGSSIVLDVYPKSVFGSKDSERKHCRILQEPGSLLITAGKCYTDTLHGISEVEIDEDLSETTISNWHLLGDKEQFREGRNIRAQRVSLTYRDVRKVVQMGSGAKNTLLGKR
jgi:alkylated DNA repair protein alkB homolog 6